MFSYRSLEERIAQDPPSRPMRVRVNEALEEVSPGWVFTFTAPAYHLVRLRNLAVAI